MPITGRTRISTLVGIDAYAEEVLEEYGIYLDEVDGHATLEQACRKAGVNYWEVKSELVANLPEDDSDMNSAWDDHDEDDEDDDVDDEGEDDDGWADEEEDAQEDDWGEEDWDDDADMEDVDDADGDDLDDDEIGGMERHARPTRWGDWK